MKIKLTSIYLNDQAPARRMTPLGAAFTMSPAKVTGSTIAMLDDPCGARIQVAALDRRVG